MTNNIFLPPIPSPPPNSRDPQFYDYYYYKYLRTLVSPKNVGQRFIRQFTIVLVHPLILHKNRQIANSSLYCWYLEISNINNAHRHIQNIIFMKQMTYGNRKKSLLHLLLWDCVHDFQHFIILVSWSRSEYSVFV